MHNNTVFRSWSRIGILSLSLVVMACGSPPIDDVNASADSVPLDTPTLASGSVPSADGSEVRPNVPTTEDQVESLDELLAIPIDQLPVKYSTSSCELLDKPPEPDPISDYLVEELGLDEIVARAPQIVRARVIDVGRAQRFTPVGLSPEYLESTGASSPAELAVDSTPVTVEVEDVVQGSYLVGDKAIISVAGCWSSNATSLTTLGGNVLLFAVSSVEASGIDQELGSELRLYDWQEVTVDGVVSSGAKVVFAPSEFAALEGRPVEAVISDLRDAAEHVEP